MPQQYYSIIVMIATMAFFYFFIMRPQKKKENELNNIRANVKVGDKIVSIGGIVGTIVIVKEDYITIETSGMKTRIELAKWAINSVDK